MADLRTSKLAFPSKNGWLTGTGLVPKAPASASAPTSVEVIGRSSALTLVSESFAPTLAESPSGGNLADTSVRESQVDEIGSAVFEAASADGDGDSLWLLHEQLVQEARTDM